MLRSFVLREVTLHWLRMLVPALVLSLASVGAQSADQWVYKVKPGDNLWNFTKEHLTSMRFLRRLQALNRVADPTRLPPGSQLKVPMPWLKVKPVPVIVKSVSGTARATNVLGENVPVVPGAKLLIGSKLITGENTDVVLLFADKTEVAVRSNSEMSMDSLSQYGTTGMVDSRLRLNKGRLGATVTKAKGPGSQFQIRTAAATAAVRGTVERIAADGNSMRAEVTEGEVLVSGSGANVVVPEGFATRADAGTPPEPARPLLPAPDFSAFSGVVERLPPRVSWPAVDGAVSYRIQVAADNTFAILLHESISPVAAMRGLDLADGDYWLRVRAIDKDDIEGLDATVAFTLNARPEPPFTRTPAFGASVRDQFAPLTWAEPTEAVGYRVQVAKDEDFNEILVTATPTGGSFLPDLPVEFGQYYWRVATTIASGETGPYSDVQEFELKPSPPQPKPEPPDIGKEELGFRWSAGDPGQTYHFQFARDEKFTDIVHDETLAEPTIKIKRPASGNYYLRVATVDTDGYRGPFSTPQLIEVPYEGIIHAIIGVAGALLILL